MLVDGSYDVVVVDASEGATEGDLTVELAVLGGPHKGEMVTITARGLDRDPLDLLASPGTLVVAAGAPRFVLED